MEERVCVPVLVGVGEPVELELGVPVLVELDVPVLVALELLVCDGRAATSTLISVLEVVPALFVAPT